MDVVYSLPGFHTQNFQHFYGNWPRLSVMFFLP